MEINRKMQNLKAILNHSLTIYQLEENIRKKVTWKTKKNSYKIFLFSLII